MKTIEERAHEKYGCVIAGKERTYDESLGNAYIEGAKEQQELMYQQIRNHCNAISLMHYLDVHLPEGKMCLSSMECEDLEDAWNKNDWEKIIRYIHKYEDKNS